MTATLRCSVGFWILPLLCLVSSPAFAFDIWQVRDAQTYNKGEALRELQEAVKGEALGGNIVAINIFRQTTHALSQDVLRDHTPRHLNAS